MEPLDPIPALTVTACFDDQAQDGNDKYRMTTSSTTEPLSGTKSEGFSETSIVRSFLTVLQPKVNQCIVNMKRRMQSEAKSI